MENPLLPGLPLPPTSRKTLFLDMDETLIRHVPLTVQKPDHHDFTTSTGYVIKRPYVNELLQIATDHNYEIVVFTAGCEEYASPIIDWLNPDKLIKHRLYRDSCKRNRKGNFFKDLSLTGRDLSRCLIVDDMWQRVAQIENVVRIKPFKGDMRDTEIKKVSWYFEIEGKFDDLRDAVSHLNVWLSPVVRIM